MSIHLKKFNQRIQAMNQNNSKELVLTAKEARDLHSEIQTLLLQISELNKHLISTLQSVQNTPGAADGGGF